MCLCAAAKTYHRGVLLLGRALYKRQMQEWQQHRKEEEEAQRVVQQQKIAQRQAEQQQEEQRQLDQASALANQLNMYLGDMEALDGQGPPDT